MMDTQTPKKYVSDAIDLEDISRGALNLIYAPIGSGKTQFALDELSKLVMSKQAMVYLTDSVMSKEQIANHPNAVLYDTDWLNDRKDGMIQFNDLDEKITVMTYAMFGTLVKFHPEFTKYLELIVCDELHNIFWPIYAAKGSLKKTAPLLTDQEAEDMLSMTSANYIAVRTLEELCYTGKSIVVALTATPSKVYKRFAAEISTIPVASDLVGYETRERKPYRNLEYELSKLEQGKKYMVYIQRISPMIEHMRSLEERGFRAGAVWSLGNKDHPMTEQQKAWRQYIVDEQKLPDDIDVFFFNKSCETSINIFGHVDAIYIHSSDEDVITQARGRYRGDLDKLYTFNRKTEYIAIPDQFIGKLLYTEDKSALAKVLNIKTEGNRLSKWPTIRDTLNNEGRYLAKDLEKKVPFVTVDGKTQRRHASAIYPLLGAEDEEDA